MGKTVKRIQYALKDVGMALSQESSECLLFWLYFCYRPFRTVMFNGFLTDQIYAFEHLRQRMYWFNKKGYIKRIKNNRQTWFTFNKEERFRFLDDAVGEKAGRFKQPWDKKWRLVIYDIPNKFTGARDALRRYLVGLGFGRVQLSSWASCYDYSADIHDFCRQYKILNFVCIYEGQFFSGMDTNKLVEKAWDLTGLSERYQAITDESVEYIRDIETQKVKMKDYYEKYCRLFAEFKAALSDDPFLPREFSGAWEYRTKAEESLFRLFHLFSNSLPIRM